MKRNLLMKPDAISKIRKAILRCVLPLFERSKTRLGEDHLLRMNKESVHSDQVAQLFCATRRRATSEALLRWLPIIVLIFFTVPSPIDAGTDPAVKAYTSNLPFTMPEIEIPDIPNTRLTITDFGAVGDGNTMNTDAIASTIQHCLAKGGGVVEIPPGMWLTGPIRLESNIEFHLDSGAVILFSKRFEDYPMFKRPKISEKCVPMIYGSGLHDVAITGRGLIDGNGQYWHPVKKEKLTDRQWKELVASGGAVTSDGKMWWPSKEAMNGEDYLKDLKKVNKKPSPVQIAGAREFLRPVMVALDDCKRVLFDGSTFTNAPGWTLAPTRCEEVVIRNVTVNNPSWGQNTDAIDINS
ncbi:MAG: glycosyl hydrolase family 28 protein, partial [Bacteroidota bacterium]